MKAIRLTTKTSFPLNGACPRVGGERRSRTPYDFAPRLGLAIFFLLLPILAFFPAPDLAHSVDLKADLNLSTAYRVDDLSWNIAGSNNNPNVLSELTWDDLEMIQATLSGKALVNEWLYVRGSFGYGYTFSGDNQDSDYAGNDRTREFSRSSNSADCSRVLDAAMGLGYQFSFLSGRFRLSPLFGYSYNSQDLKLNDGFQVIATPGVTPPVGPIQGLDSAYDASWVGPWLGIDLSFAVSERVTLFGTFEYHWATFDAEADLNLRSDLAHPTSFDHDADGKGFVLTLGAEYLLTRPWSLNMAFSYQNWSTDAGVDRLYYANGSIAETRLNEVDWDSFSLMVGVVYRFGQE